MKMPDENGRAAILRYYLKPLKMEPGIGIDALAAGLAAATNGASGADLEYLCQSAARICVKEATATPGDRNGIHIAGRHLHEAMTELIPRRHLVK